MWEIADVLKISKSMKLFMKMNSVSFILWEKAKWTFWPAQYNSKYKMLSFGYKDIPAQMHPVTPTNT